jgi:predicted nucleotidyltransferase
MYKIKEIFLEMPEAEFHIREIAGMLKINPMTARKYLIQLKNEDFVTEIPSKLKVKNYRLNAENPLVKEEKKNHIIRKLMESGLIEYLNRQLNQPAIVLFGSAAKGEDTSMSDIDMFVYSETKKEINAESYEKKIKRRLQLFMMNEKEFEENKKRNKHLINNILNGTVISGFIEVFK